jgi:CRP-like cAMP-binding protein
MSSQSHLLAGVGVFAGLDIETLNRLGRGPELTYAGIGARGSLGPNERDIIFRQGTPSDAVYAITGGAGRVRVGVPDQTGKRLMVEVLRQGDVFGEIGVIEASTRTADAYAEGPVRLVRIPRDAFLAVLADTPRLGLNLAQLLASRLRRTFTLFQDASFETVEARLARQVLYLADRDGRRSDRGRALAGQLRQADLADLLGTTTRSVISILNAWRSQGWVSYDGDKALLVILDEPKLRGLLAAGKRRRDG